MSSRLILLFIILVLSCWARQASAQAFNWTDSQDVVGKIKRTAVTAKDTLYDVGMAHGIGFNEMRVANPTIDAWLPADGSEVVVPSEFILPSIREGVVINLREYRLYFFPEGGAQVITYPVGIGKETSPSPLISTQVKLKIEKPNWYPPKSVREAYFVEHGEELSWEVPPGPKNPLGPYAIQLDLPDYFIHGTNKSFGIGTKISRGCIRLDNDDLSKFVWEVPKYTPVTFIEEPVKVGMRGDELVVEFHFDKHNDDQTRQIAEDQIIDTVVQKVGQIEKSVGPITIDFAALHEALKAPKGFPQTIGIKKADLVEVSLVLPSQLSK